MSEKPGYPGQSFFIWVFANLLGFSALAVLLFVLPALMSIRGFAAAALIIIISFVVAVLVYAIATGLIFSRLVASHDKSQPNASNAI